MKLNHCYRAKCKTSHDALLATLAMTAIADKYAHRMALTPADLDALHQRLVGVPDRPTINPGKVTQS